MQTDAELSMFVTENYYWSESVPMLDFELPAQSSIPATTITMLIKKNMIIKKYYERFSARWPIPSTS